MAAMLYLVWDSPCKTYRKCIQFVEVGSRYVDTRLARTPDIAVAFGEQKPIKHRSPKNASFVWTPFAYRLYTLRVFRDVYARNGAGLLNLSSWATERNGITSTHYRPWMSTRCCRHAAYEEKCSILRPPMKSIMSWFAINEVLRRYSRRCRPSKLRFLFSLPSHPWAHAGPLSRMSDSTLAIFQIGATRRFIKKIENT